MDEKEFDWNILDLYFNSHKYPFTSHHLDSYREFLKTYLPNTIKSYNPITMIKYDEFNNIIIDVNVYVGGINSDKIFIDKPIIFEEGIPKLITPNDCRLKNLTYESHIYADVLIVIKNAEKEIVNTEFKNIAIGSIPIMLHSDGCILNGQGTEAIKKLGECIYDNGGYFIIDGKEKVVVSQERIATNKLFIMKNNEDDKDFSHKSYIKCTSEFGENKLIPRTLEFYYVKNPDLSTQENVTEKYRSYKNSILVSIPSVSGYMSLPIFFRILGIESDKDIYECIFGKEEDLSDVEKIFYKNFIRPILSSSFYMNETEDERIYIYTQKEGFDYLKDRVVYKTLDHVKYILTNDIFPNIDKFENKGKYLGYLIKQFIDVIMGFSAPSDRDGYIYKRVDTSGYLISELFQESYMTLRKSIRDKLDNFYYYGSLKQNNDFENFINNDNIYKLIDFLLIAKTFSRSLKGSWGLATDDDPEQGKVQDLNRLSYLGFLTHLRSVNMPIDRTLKIVSPHKLHPQQWGYMCPFTTPDGASIGYLKNLAFLAKIAAGTTTINIKKCLIDIGVIPIELYNYTLNKNITKIFVNNTWFAITGEPIKIYRTLKAYKRNNLINILTSISWQVKTNEIRISTEAGRPCRPLIILNKGTIPLLKNKYDNWFNLLCLSGYGIVNEKIYYLDNYINPSSLDDFKDKSDKEILKILEEKAGVVEYLDTEEQDVALIAMKKEDITEYHTHLEINPATMFSALSINIPFSNHNAAVRNLFHSAQSKQAIGVYSTNFNKRFDTAGYIQHYPQKPLVSTRLSQYTLSDNMPNGFNVIVAIMSHTGFNQEDSIMINKKSIERGLFNVSYYKSITATSKIVSPIEKIIFGNPLKLKESGIKINLKHANYDYLDDKGLIKEGIYIPSGQTAVVVGMIKIKDVIKEVRKGVFVEQVKNTIYTDVSITTDNSLYGFVNKTHVSTKTATDNSIVYKVRFLKIKKPELGDKHGSRHGQKGVVGMIIPEENMPFTKDGVKPDIIINPHAIPSRMTIGHLLECVFAKFCSLEGYTGDGTVYLPYNENYVYEGLEKMGFNRHANEILYNGFNGTQIATEIFIGPTFYFRLKQMVAEKIHARSTGPMVMLTRQPTGGRRNYGGLRIGEMERDSVLCHGISSFMKESMMERADKFLWAICKRCGILSVYNKKNKICICKNCNRNDLCLIKTPYSFKLLIQEFESMNIQFRINTEHIEKDLLEEDIDDEIYSLMSIDDKVIKKEEKTQVAVSSITKQQTKTKAKTKDIPEGKIINPNTGRLISATGTIAKKLGLTKKIGGEGEEDDYEEGEEEEIEDGDEEGEGEEEEIDEEDEYENGDEEGEEEEIDEEDEYENGDEEGEEEEIDEEEEIGDGDEYEEEIGDDRDNEREVINGGKILDNEIKIIRIE